LAEVEISGHILLVEDDRDTRRLLGIQLGRLGYRVTQAGTAGECLEALRLAGQAPDLVLLDRHLPDGDGGDVLQHIRQDADLPKMPVMVISADQRAESITGMLASGAVDYLVKPFDSRVLEARVAAAIREARQKLLLLRTQQVLARIKRELQLIFDVVNEAVVLIDGDMIIRRVNRTALAWTGKAAYGDLLGRKCHEAGYGLHEPCADCPVQKAFREGRDQECEMARELGGRTIHMRCRVFLLEPAEDGRPLAVEVIEDVSDQRIRREKELSEERLRAVVRLAGGLAHEISQPLAAVSGRAELLGMALADHEKPPDPAEVARHLESLRENSLRIGEIVRRLQNINEFVTKPYYGSTEIIDLDRSSGRAAEGPPPYLGPEARKGAP
jgi:PAS domain S-box-containing protein